MTMHRHKEAFMLMRYWCDGEHPELIWNSRDGITPFSVRCHSCQLTAYHVDWHRDLYAPDYNPPLGDRYFRDGLPEEAAAIMRHRIEALRPDFPIDPDQETALIADARAGRLHEFQPGWPLLATRGTDNDTLPTKG